MKNQKMSEVVFCALDLETTGSNPIFNRIVEVGMVRFSLDKIIDVYETLVDPEIDIPDDVISIHGITDSMVASSPKIEDILDDITDFIGDSILVIQGPIFDLTFLDQAYKEYGKKAPRLKSIDTVRLGRHAFPSLHNHKLKTICTHLGINLNHHRALSDARACMEIFKSFVNQFDPDDSWDLSDLLDLHGKFIKPRIIKKVNKYTKIFRKITIGEVSKIRYSDSHGNETVREILPQEIIKYGNKNYILAYCFLRQGKRYFQADNILKIFE
ncbi:exonuclease domain-containing protein [Spirochaetota bacterium]